MNASVRTTARDRQQQALTVVHADGLLPELPKEILLERPTRPEHGDYTTHRAIALAKSVGKHPRVNGEALAQHLRVV